MSDGLSLADRFRALPKEEQERRWNSLSEEERAANLYDWSFWARPNQLPPPGDWQTWLILAGRGFGKTKAGAQWIIAQSETCRRMALVGPTAADVRDAMIEGESGILASSPPWNMPRYEPSKRKVTWPNGSFALCFSAEEPRRLRGPQFFAAWCDELAAWKYDQDTFDMLQFGLRLGKKPRQVVTTTPRPTKIIKELRKDKTVVVTTGTSYENRRNLAVSFFDRIVSKYEGTRLGRQELNAEILDDNPNSFWTLTRIDLLRVDYPPPLMRVVVGVDPAVSSNPNSDETGIVVCGLGYDGHGYVLDDRSLVGSPEEWGISSVEAYRSWEADRIVAEVNNGGDLVESNIRAIDRSVSYKAVHASRGKAVRAEPVSALYEQGKVHHVGAFPALEDQMTQYDPTVSGQPSPDRMDALVWGLTELMLKDSGHHRLSMSTL